MGENLKSLSKPPKKTEKTFSTRNQYNSTLELKKDDSSYLTKVPRDISDEELRANIQRGFELKQE